MPTSISGAQYPVSKIFCSDFSFHIPSYQRPYSWTTEQASELFDDLVDFHSKEDTEEYFLGSIVLIKEDGAPLADVIDGQQRLTTLTILMACIAERTPKGEARDEFMKYIREPGNRWEGLEQRPRLSIRPRDNDFFSEYIQGLNIDPLLGLEPSRFDTEAKRNIQSNAALYREKLSKCFQDEVALERFAMFVLQRCVMVAVCTPTQNTAFRVFSVMNSRGLDLLPTDLIKAELIGSIPEGERNGYTEKWEEMEAKSGRDGFEEVFRHLRMIYVKEKARRALLEEFREHVLPRHRSPQDLIESVLTPHVNAYNVIINSSYTASNNAGEVNANLRWLNRMEHSDWVPPGMAFLANHDNDSAEAERFFGRLERVSAFLYLSGAYANQRIARMAQILSELEADAKNPSELSSLELTPGERTRFVQILDGDVYLLPARKRAYLMLRLDSFISDGAASYEPSLLTIEHVLPQTVRNESQWSKDWPDQDVREQWLHKISNLVPLTRSRNSAAQNYDFDKKKDKYFTGGSGVTSYALTSQVVSQDRWTPQVVVNRQKVLLDVLASNWNLA